MSEREKSEEFISNATHGEKSKIEGYHSIVDHNIVNHPARALKKDEGKIRERHTDDDYEGE